MISEFEEIAENKLFCKVHDKLFIDINIRFSGESWHFLHKFRKEIWSFYTVYGYCFCEFSNIVLVLVGYSDCHILRYLSA
nr:MAG TPA: hypothetical protein [Caudoviricetes sp.]